MTNASAPRPKWTSERQKEERKHLKHYDHRFQNQASVRLIRVKYTYRGLPAYNCDRELEVAQKGLNVWLERERRGMRAAFSWGKSRRKCYFQDMKGDGNMKLI